MRLRSLAVKHFGCVAEATVPFSPRLNVLYGSNDAGKSTLAEAIRAALLLPCNASEHKRFVAWGSEHAPRVVLVFEKDGRLWRVTKTFSSKGEAKLDTSSDGLKWATDATARAVDGRLREMLAWGAPIPGGKCGPRGFVKTYLGTVFLGRQGEVDAILGSSLAEDPCPTGLEAVTKAVGEMVQDPLVRRIFETLEERVATAFTDRQNRRQTRDSPLVRIRDEINGYEKKIRALEEEVRRTDEVRRVLQDGLTARATLAADADAAAARVKEAREGLDASKRRKLAGEALARARAEHDRIVAARTAAAAAQAALVPVEGTLTTAEARVQTSQATVDALEAKTREERERLEGARTAHATAASGTAHEKEKREAKRTAERKQAEDRLAAAKEVAALDRHVASLRAASGKADAELGTARANLKTAQDQVRYLQTRESHDSAKRAHADLGTAGTEIAALDGQAARLTEAIAAAEADLAKTQQAAVDVREAGPRAKVEAAKREAEIEALEVAAVRARSVEREALESAERARALLSMDGRIASRKTELDLATAAVEADDRRLADLSQKIQAAEQDLRDLDLVRAALRRDDLARRLREAKEKAGLVTDLRERAARGRARAGELEATGAGARLPPADRLAGLREIDARWAELRDRPATPAPAVSPALPLVASAGAAVVVGVAMWALAGTSPLGAATAGIGAGILVGAILFALARSRGADAVRTQEAADTERAYAKRRWDDEVGRVLQAASVPDLDTLEMRCREGEERRAEAARLRSEADRLETEALLSRGELQSSAGLEAELADCTARLAVPGGDGIPARAEKFRAPGALETARREAETLIDSARRARDALNQEQARELIRVESLRATLDSARAERDSTARALGADPTTVLARAEAAIATARRESEALQERIRVARTQAPAQAAAVQRRLEDAEAAVATSAASLKQRRAERDEAMRKLADAQARRDVLARQTANHDLQALAARVEEARAELGKGRPEAKDLPAATAARDQAEKALEAATLQASGARSAVGEAARGFERAQAALGARWAEVTRDAEAVLARLATPAADDAALGAPIAKVQADLRAAEVRFAAAERELKEAKAVAAREAATRDRARAGRDQTRGQAEERQRFADGLDLPAAETALAAATAALAALPASSATDADLVRLTAERDALNRKLRVLEDGIREAQGKLSVAGGIVAFDRLRDYREARERCLAQAGELELDLEAARLLLNTLKEAHAQHAAHLGASLCGPVTELFSKLTNGRYPRFVLDPHLRATGVAAGGADRELDTLSVGTREQLATLLRLALAARLKSFLLLDDQLAHSDWKRLMSVRDCLRASVRDDDHQIVVITCRPLDYLVEGELPADGAPAVHDGGNLAVLNVERVITRAF